ncbi:MAG TPA: hypothetical protein VME23_16540 [Terracidiphilus sp.]|nr:hypothetical protein [Terracidiphilus sp.]
MTAISPFSGESSPTRKLYIGKHSEPVNLRQYAITVLTIGKHLASDPKTWICGFVGPRELKRDNARLGAANFWLLLQKRTFDL